MVRTRLKFFDVSMLVRNVSYNAALLIKPYTAYTNYRVTELSRNRITGNGENFYNCHTAIY